MYSSEKHETVHNKKLFHMQKPFQRAGGYRIGFLQFYSYEEIMGFLNYKIMLN